MNISFADTKLYEIFVVKNGYIKEEYDNYIKINFQKKGRRNRVLEWIFLLRLNLAYKILNRKKDGYEAKSGGESSRSFCNIDAFAFERIKPHQLAMQLLNYEVISFDIFDTLLLRPFKKPSDLFHIIGKRLNFEGFAFSFYRVRTEIEKELRDEKYRRIGSREITIYDIYHEIERRTNIAYEEGLNEEIQAEMDYCFANPYMLQVFKILKNQGKRIIATSDMYLPREIMIKLLSGCEYEGFDRIYVSCDYECSKNSNGRNLFHIVKSDYADKSICHVGDNMISDIDRAQKEGLYTAYYKNVHQVSETLNNVRMAEVLKGSYLGLIECKLYNGVKNHSFFYQYGYAYGGIYVLGYMKWIDRFVRDKKIDKLLFVARDGYVYKKVYDKICGSVESAYLYWSRVALMKYCVADRNFEDFFERVVKIKAANSAESVSIGYFLRIFEIDNINLVKFNLDERQELNDSVLKNLKQCLLYYWDQIQQTYEAGKKAFCKLLLAEIGRAETIGIVDASSNGYGLMNLKYLIESLTDNAVRVNVFMADRVYANNRGFVYDESVHCYLFSETVNNDCYTSMYGRHNSDGAANLAFEFLTQAPHARFAGIDKKEKFLFDPPENENYEATGEISTGIVDFCNDFTQTFRKDRYIFENISGSEAFRPFEIIARNKAVLRKYFKDIVVEKNIVGGNAKGRKETYADIIK